MADVILNPKTSALLLQVRVARRPDLKDAPRAPLGTPPGSSGLASVG